MGLVYIYLYGSIASDDQFKKIFQNNWMHGNKCRHKINEVLQHRAGRTLNYADKQSLKLLCVPWQYNHSLIAVLSDCSFIFFQSYVCPTKPHLKFSNNSKFLADLQVYCFENPESIFLEHYISVIFILSSKCTLNYFFCLILLQMIYIIWQVMRKNHDMLLKP